MGSLTRKLRAQAGVAGRAYQADQRSQAAARARTLELASKVAVSAKSPGSPFGAPLPPSLAWAAEAARQAETRRVELAMVLGSHDGAAELADALDAYGTKLGRASSAATSDVRDWVWSRALLALRLGASRVDVVAALAADEVGSALRMLSEPELAKRIDSWADQSGGAALVAQPGHEPTLTFDASETSAAAAIAQVAPALAPELRPPAAGLRLSRRMPLLQQALLVGSLLAMASGPKGGR
jgi:hypothetical protein